MSNLEFPAIMHDERTTIPVIILAPSYERCLADIDHATGTGGLWDGWECIVLGTEGAPDQCGRCGYETRNCTCPTN